MTPIAKITERFQEASGQGQETDSTREPNVFERIFDLHNGRIHVKYHSAPSTAADNGLTTDGSVSKVIFTIAHGFDILPAR